MLNPPEPIPYLYVGSASWKYDSWQGLIYPEDAELSTGNYLPHYAHYFNMVEVDQYFWSLFPPDHAKMPDRQEVELYSKSVPEEFRFVVKAPNSITLTHFYKQQSGKYKEFAGKENPHGFLNADLWHQFLWTLEPMKSQLGAVILQFSYLNGEMLPGGLPEFLNRLDDFLDQAETDVPIAIECRNPNFLKRRYFEFLKRHNIPHVYLNGYYMPDPAEIYQQFGNTGDFSIFRMHGSDRKAMERATGGKWDSIVEEHDEELQNIVSIAQDEIHLERDFYLSINNHFEGSSPQSIQRFYRRLDLQMKEDY